MRLIETFAAPGSVLPAGDGHMSDRQVSILRSVPATRMNSMCKRHDKSLVPVIPVGKRLKKERYMVEGSPGYGC